MSVFVKPLMDWFMFGMVIETGPKFYMVPFPIQKVTDSEFLYKIFVINVLQFQFFCKAFNGFFFAKPSMDFIQLWRDDRALSKILCSTIPIPVRGARWLSGRVSDSGARGRGFETYRRRVVSLSKTLYSPKVLVNYPGSGGSVPIWLKNCWLGR